MTIQKRILAADRVRHPPTDGFSWIDRRFLREFAVRLSGDAVFLYFFLTAVSDKQGLSFYSDSTLAVRMRTRRNRPGPRSRRADCRQPGRLSRATDAGPFATGFTCPA